MLELLGGGREVLGGVPMCIVYVIRCKVLVLGCGLEFLCLRSRVLTCLGCGLEFLFFLRSRVLTCLTYTNRRGSQHRGQTTANKETLRPEKQSYRGPEQPMAA